MGIVAFINLGLIAVAIEKPMAGHYSGSPLVMAISGIVGALLGGVLVLSSSDADPLDEVLRHLHLR